MVELYDASMVRLDEILAPLNHVAYYHCRLL